MRACVRSRGDVSPHTHQINHSKPSISIAHEFKRGAPHSTGNVEISAMSNSNRAVCLCVFVYRRRVGLRECVRVGSKKRRSSRRTETSLSTHLDRALLPHPQTSICRPNLHGIVCPQDRLTRTFLRLPQTAPPKSWNHKCQPQESVCEGFHGRQFTLCAVVLAPCVELYRPLLFLFLLL